MSLLKRKRERPITTLNGQLPVIPDRRSVNESETPKAIPVSCEIQKVARKKSPKYKKVSPSIIPENLKCMGNYKAWNELIEHLHSPNRHVPVILYGPVGCGKTYGVEECLKLSNLKPVTIDGAAPSGVEELMTWIKSVVQNQSIGNNENVLFLDDIEGFIHSEETIR
jgi:replication-associated recombination protein RarA